MKIKNPFRYDSFALGNSFCGRIHERQSISQLCHDGKNVLLYGKRRYGKSSLIHELCEHEFGNNTLTVYVDLFEMLDANDFARLFYQACAKAMKFSLTNAASELLNYFKKVHFNVSVGQSGAPTFTPTLASRDFDELIEDTFAGLQRYAAKENKTVVVAFDEFQQILDIKNKKIDAIIRKHIQYHDQISYIFSGSKRHLLTGLFTHHKRPLFSLATGIELHAIESGEFYVFANNHLDGRLQKDAFDWLYNQVEGESKLLQEMCYHLWYQQGEIDQSQVMALLAQIVRQSDGEYRALFEHLTKSQKTALKAIALTNGQGLFKQEVLSDLNTNKQTLMGALKALMKTEMIDREEGRYFPTDKKFDLWCRQLFRPD